MRLVFIYSIISHHRRRGVVSAGIKKSQLQGQIEISQQNSYPFSNNGNQKPERTGQLSVKACLCNTALVTWEDSALNSLAAVAFALSSFWKTAEVQHHGNGKNTTMWNGAMLLVHGISRLLGMKTKQRKKITNSMRRLDVLANDTAATYSHTNELESVQLRLRNDSLLFTVSTQCFPNENAAPRKGKKPPPTSFCSSAASSSAAVNSCALAKLSTAIAKNTFSSVSGWIRVKVHPKRNHQQK